MSDDSVLKRRLDREIKARKTAEQILESKAIQLYNANISLQALNKKLEGEIQIKSNQLEENELRYKSLVDEARDSIFNFSNALKISYANAKTIDIFGIPADQLIGKNISELVRVDYLDYATAFLEQFRKHENPESYVELPLVHEVNKHLWVGINLTYVEDSTGNYFSAICRDISERKTVEANLEKAVLGLERSEHKYRGILKNMQLGILETGDDNKIKDANQIFCEMIGYSADELIDKIPGELLLHEDNFPLRDQKNLSAGSSLYPVYDVRLKKKSGDLINVLISLAPIYNLEGEETGTIAIHYDITEQYLLQKKLTEAKDIAEHARRAEQKFLAVMTHEIRTPLNAILGMSHLLADTDLNTEQAEYVGLVKNAADMLQSIVSDILDLSKIQAGKIDINNETFDLITLLDNCLKTIKIKSSDPNVKIVFDQGSFNTLWIDSDKKLIHQIVINLLDNAIKFTHQGQITLKLEDRQNNVVSLSVQDTGIGIAEDKLKIIFKEFEQADEGIHGTYGGTGLGLSICQKLARLLGSKLSVESQVDIGTTFSMNLVVKPSEDKHETLAKTVSVESKINELDILIAEDNQMNQKYITKLLDKKGIKYQLAHNGVEAVRAASTKVFDIILMDLHMPEMDGYQATRSIKLKGKNVDTPIVALTASTMLSQKEEAFNAGMEDFLSKPFSPTQLFLLLEKYCKIQVNDNVSLENQNTNSIPAEINENLIQEYLGDDAEYQSEMFSLFINTYKTEKVELETAFNSQNLDNVKSVLHKMKPTFQMVGLQKLFELINKSERQAAEGNQELLTQKDFILKSLENGVKLIEDRLVKP